jgi:hypothetical protein
MVGLLLDCLALVVREVLLLLCRVRGRAGTVLTSEPLAPEGLSTGSHVVDESLESVEILSRGGLLSFAL